MSFPSAAAHAGFTDSSVASLVDLYLIAISNVNIAGVSHKQSIIPPHTQTICWWTDLRGGCLLLLPRWLSLGGRHALATITCCMEKVSLAAAYTHSPLHPCQDQSSCVQHLCLQCHSACQSDTLVVWWVHWWWGQVRLHKKLGFDNLKLAVDYICWTGRVECNEGRAYWSL